jgi:hypothetical protein
MKIPPIDFDFIQIHIWQSQIALQNISDTMESLSSVLAALALHETTLFFKYLDNRQPFSSPVLCFWTDSTCINNVDGQKP